MKQVSEMSKNKESKVRFGVLDAVIIIIVVAVVASVVLRYTTDNNLFEYDTQKYTVTIKTCGVRYTSVDNVASASEYYLDNGAVLGVSLHAPTVTPMQTYVTDRSGGLVACYYPDNTFVDIVVELQCDLIEKNGSVMTKSGDHIASGAELTVYANSVELDVEIIEVQKSIDE
jgi:hypothetical protein